MEEITCMFTYICMFVGRYSPYGTLMLRRKESLIHHTSPISNIILFAPSVAPGHEIPQRDPPFSRVPSVRTRPLYLCLLP